MNLKYGPYSPSRLEVATCGYRFYREYIKKDLKKKRSTQIQDRGSAVHDILEYMTNKIKVNPDHVFSRMEIQAQVAEAVNRFPAAYEVMETVLKCAENYIQRPPRTLTDDAETELRLAVEYRDGAFVECDYDDPKAFARGRADIMMISDDTTSALVYDHKTQLNIETADTFQMGFYAWVISKIYPFLREVNTILHFSQYGHYSKPFRWMVRLSKEELEAMPVEDRNNCISLETVEAEILSRIDVVETTTDITPTPNDKCQYCPLIGECPVIEELFSIENGQVTPRKGLTAKVVDTTSATKAASAIHVLETYLKDAKKELSKYTAKTGSIALPSGIHYGYRPTLSLDWDHLNKKGRKPILEILEKHGVDFKDFTGFSSTFSKKLLKSENQALIAEIINLIPEKGMTKFGSYKL